MTRGRLHRAAAAVLTALLLVSSAAPAQSNDEHTDPARESTSPPAFDLLVLRPFGLIALAVGTGVFLAPVLPVTLLTRPTDLDMPFGKLVLNPIRYVFVDPLGEH